MDPQNPQTQASNLPVTPPAPTGPEPSVPTVDPMPATPEPQVASPTESVEPMPMSSDGKPKGSSMVMKVAIIFLVVALLSVIGYVAYAMFLAPSSQPPAPTTAPIITVEPTPFAIESPTPFATGTPTATASPTIMATSTPTSTPSGTPVN